MFKRPLLTLTCIFASGILYSQFFIWLSFAAILASSFITGLLFIRSRLKIYIIISLGLMVFAVGTVYSHQLSLSSSISLQPYSGSTVFFTAQITSQPDIRDSKTNYMVEVKEISSYGSTKTVNSKALLSVYSMNENYTSFRFGDLVSGTGKISMPSPARNPGGFDYKRFLASQGVYSRITSMSSDLNYMHEGNLNPFIRFSLKLRNNIILVIDSSLPAEQAALLKGIVIGERGSFSEQMEQNFSASGLTHILCVSGANIAYVAGACMFLLSFLKVKPPYQGLITVFVLILFTYITGCSPSVVRAAIMGIMLLAGSMLNRKSDVLTSLSAACLFILLHNPLTLYDIGFQLSVGGTAGIILFYKSLSGYLNFLPKVINEVLSVTLAAQLTVNPIIALYFNKISIIAVVSNMIVVPLTGAVTILGFIMSIAGQFAIILAKFIGGLTFFFLSFIIWVSELSASIPFAVINVITPGVFFIVPYYIILFVLLWYIPVRKPGPKFYKTFSGFVAFIIVFTLIKVSIPQPVQITFLDIGQGDCSFIKTRSGKTCLIDGGGTFPGSTTSFDPASTVIPFILDKGTSRINLAILSHAHGDHIQGIIKAVESLEVEELVIGPQPQPTNADLKKLLNLCKIRNTKIIKLSRGDSISMDGIEFKALHPLPAGSTDLNSNSLVVMLTSGNTRVLFAGDIDTAAEKEIMDSVPNINADILKIPHHGSPKSSSDNFLKRVTPSVSIISVGKNCFGHPSAEVIKRAGSYGSRIYRTDINGGINVTIYKDKFKVTPTLN